MSTLDDLKMYSSFQTDSVSANTNKIINFNSDQLLEDKRFYVYVYCDQRKPGYYKYPGIDFVFLYEPFYVGKGKDYRYLDHLREAKKLRKGTRWSGINFIKLGIICKIQDIIDKDPIIIKIKENLTDRNASYLEIELIKLIGRINLKSGVLANFTNGGDGHAGSICSDETKEKLSKSLKGQKRTDEQKKNYKGSAGIIKSEETRLKISKANTGKKRTDEQKKHRSDISKGENNPMFNVHRFGIESPNYGKHLSEEAKRKIGEANKKHRHTDETKVKISKSLKGQKRTDEQKKNYSKAQKGKIVSEEARKNMSAAHKGKSAYSIWLTKYGKEEADKRQLELNIKCAETKKRNKLLKEQKLSKDYQDDNV